jgi:hypothetical protein
MPFCPLRRINSVYERNDSDTVISGIHGECLRNSHLTIGEARLRFYFLNLLRMTILVGANDQYNLIRIV